MKDLKLALRSLVRSPGFTIVAVLTLALGIGANTAIFTVIQGVLLQPLPYDEPEQIVPLLEQVEPVPAGLDLRARVFRLPRTKPGVRADRDIPRSPIRI